ncbi:sensor domain-containing diguanylate cyclase [Pseudomonas chlororaphis]|uniref:sensor domain-containing diguanylate cyclase n=1 Tax=Pseudomonas chlororaphis TaxID=587753 RepID=UPI001E42E092|nr:sensor domain-containing diguanylate cyclase [Pseudomonas chlororaphis]MCB2255215.1 sensor domain-containing diguanylate cyclase [Pseudomonas chlororaphis]
MPIPIYDPHPSLDRSLKRLPLLKAAVVFISMVCLCLCGLLYLQLEQSYHYDMERARIASSNLTRSMAQQAEDTFVEADLVLASLGDWIQKDGYGPAQKPFLEKIFAQRALALKQLHGLFLFDREGHWVVTSLERLPHNEGVADRDYFRFHQQNASLLAHVGPAIRSQDSGEWIIPLSRRLNDKQGNFVGVLLAGIKLAYFDQFFKSFDIGTNGTMFLALSDGTLLARRPWEERQIGASLARGEIFSKYLPQAPSGTAMIRSLIDRKIRLYGYRQLEAYPLVVGVASSKDAILKDWYASAYQSSAIVALVVLGIGLFGWVFVHQVRNGERIEADLRTAQEALEVIATHDSLTGLANRRLFERALQTEFGRGGRQASPLSLIMLDIDFFKRYNDTYGHVAGDQCLAQVAEVLRDCCQRTADLAVRYGGEEFVVLLPDTEMQGALVIAEQIRRSVMEKNIPHTGSPFGCVTLSLGCYSFVPSGRDSAAAFLEHADAALYQAKKSGRNQVAVECASEPQVRSEH